jgi:histidinol phosphatase-like PHP family hydrolase
MNLDIDLHTHTYHSPCGQAEMLPGEIVRAAARKGIAWLAITDHFYEFTDRGIFDNIRASVAPVLRSTQGAPQVFFGCEAEVMAPGRTAGSQELADSLDFVMAATTHFQNTGITELPDGDDEFRAFHYLRNFEYAVSLPWVDVIAHPFFVVPSVCSVEILDHLQDSDLLPAIERAKENSVAMEISRRALWPGQTPFSLNFYKLCKQVGLKFTIGSDAHRLEDVGNVTILEPFLDELGITEADIWLPT